MVRIKWHLLAKHVENRVDLHHDSYRNEKGHIESKQISWTIMVWINDAYRLNK